MTYFQHIMTKNTHSFSKREKREHTEEMLDQSKPETTQANSRLCSSMLYDIKHLRWLYFFRFTGSNTFFSGSVLSAACFDRYPIALVPTTSWGLQHNPEFHNFIKWTLRDFLPTCLASVALLNCRERFHNALLVYPV